VVHPSRWTQVLAIVTLALLSMSAPARAQLSFSAPTRLSNSSGASVGPQVAVDAAGNIYIVWVDNTAGLYDIFFSKSIDGGATFSAPKNLSNNPGFSFDPRIAVDSHGAINIVWTDNSPGSSDILFSRSTDGGLTFSNPLNLSNDPPDSGSAQIAVDASGNISVVWESDNITFGLLYTHSTDGVNFSTPLNLATNTLGSFGPQLALDSIGNIYVAWQDDFNSSASISFSSSTDKGATFSAPKNLSNSTGFAMDPEVAVDASGNLDVAWEDNSPGTNDVFFSRSTDKGATFSKPADVSGSGSNAKALQMSVATGNVYLAWEANTPAVFSRDVFFAHSTDGGATFQPPVNVSNNIGNSRFPALAVDAAGNVNVSWQDSTPGPYQIFFTQSADYGATFSAVQNLSNDTGFATQVQMAADSQGNLNVVWYDDTTSVSQIYFSRFSATVKKNQPPVANAGTDQTQPATGPGGAPVTLDGSLSSDPDGDVLTFVWTEGSTVVGKSAVVSLTATMGAHTYTLTVTDAGGLSSTAVTHVTITNAPPVANAGTDQTLPATGPTTPVTLNGSLTSDPDGDALTFVWMEGSTVLGKSAVVSLTATMGAHTYTLTVTDAGGLSSTAVTHVTITNAPPVANAGADQTLPATGPTTPVTLDGSLSSDLDGDALTFAWTEGSTVVGKSAVVSLTATIGVHTYTLTVTDAGGLSSTAVTHVTITNAPPVANAGADQTLPAAGPAGTPVTLNGSLSSDLDGDALTFAWTEGSTVVGKSAVVSLTATMGVHAYTLTVTDAGGLSSTAVTHVTITNRPPVANAGADQTLQAAGPAGTPVTLNGSLSSDPDGDALTFVWAQGGTIVGKSAVVPLTLNAGAYTFTLTATDAGGLSSSAVTHVTITNTNRPPVANAGADPAFQCAGPRGTLVKLDGSASADPNGYALKFVWADSSGNVLGNSAVTSVLASLGTHTYTLTVTDSAGLSSKATTSVTVQDTLPPTLGVSLSTSVRRLKDNKLVFVNAAINVGDVCDPKPKVKLISITSNDPADRGRHVVSDVEAVGGGPVAFGTDVRSFLLRAERPENRLPLIYAVTYSATDASGNTTTTTAHWRVAFAGSGNSQNNSQNSPQNGNNGHGKHTQ
jgi:PKD domain-containing protein/K319-like protein